MPGKNLIVHIGALKTGSTSLQYFLNDHRELLSQLDFDVYSGLNGPINHLELFLATMRYERDSFAKLKMQIETNSEYTDYVQRFISEYIEGATRSNIIFTTEGLSLLRYQDEVERLRHILNADRNGVSIILYLRNKTDFLRSYKAQILKIPGREFSSNPQSSLYVADDTWLLDYATLVSVFQAGFGERHVHVVDYDEEMSRESTIIPSFLKLLDLPLERFSDLNDYHLNKT